MQPRNYFRRGTSFRLAYKNKPPTQGHIPGAQKIELGSLYGNEHCDVGGHVDSEIKPMKRAYRIAIISEHASPIAALGGADSGGQNVYVAHIARQLAKRGHSIDIFTRRDNPDKAPVVQLGQNVRVIHIPAGPAGFVPKEELLPYMGEFCRRIVDCCRKSPARYDVTHANFFMSGLASLALREAYGTPFVITFHALGKIRLLHQGDADRFPAERISIEESLVAEADGIIAECPQDRTDFLTHYQADDDRIDIVPCGFDTHEFAPGPKTLRKTLGLNPSDFVVLQLGRLVPRKGVDNVVRGIGELKRRHGIAAKLLVVGGDSAIPDSRRTPEIGRLREVASAEGVSDQVIFTGSRARNELAHYYNAADVFVSTPWYEPFGITPLEAMACGCPVIGSAVGGIQYSVADKVTGYLVPPNAPVTLADKLAQLYRDPALRHALGSAGVERVRSMFTWRDVAARLEGVYSRVMGEIGESSSQAIAQSVPTPFLSGIGQRSWNEEVRP
jgi:glycosyltransferase involved in cell wall biosynthesis